MYFKAPGNNDKYKWTNHSIQKMKYYGLSPSRVIRAIRNPQRLEVGVAPNTVAVMQSAGTKKNPYEIWVMYQEAKNIKLKSNPERSREGSSRTNKFVRDPQRAPTSYGMNPVKKIVISAWRYPGNSPIGKKIPIPDDIQSELEKVLQEL